MQEARESRAKEIGEAAKKGVTRDPPASTTSHDQLGTDIELAQICRSEEPDDPLPLAARLPPGTQERASELEGDLSNPSNCVSHDDEEEYIMSGALAVAEAAPVSPDN